VVLRQLPGSPVLDSLDQTINEVAHGSHSFDPVHVAQAAAFSQADRLCIIAHCEQCVTDGKQAIKSADNSGRDVEALKKAASKHSLAQCLLLDEADDKRAGRNEPKMSAAMDKVFNEVLTGVDCDVGAQALLLEAAHGEQAMARGRLLAEQDTVEARAANFEAQAMARLLDNAAANHAVAQARLLDEVEEIKRARKNTPKKHTNPSPIVMPAIDISSEDDELTRME
jgi:hypothetical protein